METPNPSSPVAAVTNPKRPDLSPLKEAWKRPYVARHDVKEFSQNCFSGRTLANHDALGTGPKERVIIGRETAYPVDSLIEWIEARSTKA